MEEQVENPTLKFKFKWSSRRKALNNISETKYKVKDQFGDPKIRGHEVNGCIDDPTSLCLKIKAKREFSDVEVRKGLRKLFPLRKVRTKGSSFTVDFD